MAALNARKKKKFEEYIKYLEVDIKKISVYYAGNGYEDCMQNALLKAYSNFEKFKSKQGKEILMFKNWFFKIIRNEYMNQVTKKSAADKNLEEYGERIESKMPTAKNILDQILEKEFKNQVRKIIVHFLKGNKQDQEDMQIIFWQYYKNLSQKETAEKMNMPLGTIKSRTYRAKQKIKEFIERVDKHAKLWYNKISSFEN